MARNNFNGAYATSGPTSNIRTYSHDGAKAKIIDYYSTIMTKYNGYYNESSATNTSGEYYKLYFTIPLNSEFSSLVKLTIETTTIPNSTHNFTIRLDDTCIEPFNTIKHKFSNINIKEFTDKNYNKHLNIQYYIRNGTININNNDTIKLVFIQLFKLLKDINTELITLMVDEDVEAEEYAEEDAEEDARRTTNEVVITTNSAPSIASGLSVSNVFSILGSHNSPSAPAPSIQRAPSVASIAPSVASIAPSIASIAPSVASIAPSVASIAPSVASIAPSLTPTIRTNIQTTSNASDDINSYKYNINAKKHLEYIKHLKMSRSILQLQITQLQTSLDNITTDISNEEEIYNTENAYHMKSLISHTSVDTSNTHDVSSNSIVASASASLPASDAASASAAAPESIIIEAKSTVVDETIKIIEPITIVNDIPTNKIDETKTDNVVKKHVLWSEVSDDDNY